MAATETRLLLLGAVATFEPVNGYQIRRELVSWGVEEWGNIKPGSIYHGLATLARRGDLVRHELTDAGREVAVYELSDQGREEFRRLWHEAISQVRPSAPLAFQTAWFLLPLVERHVVARLLRGRLETLDALLAAEPDVDPEHVPPHALAMSDYWDRLLRVEQEWLLRVIFRIEDGALDLAGDPPTWSPAPDDPGREMSADRERYLALLGR